VILSIARTRIRSHLLSRLDAPGVDVVIIALIPSPLAKDGWHYDQ
jgi:hypothetical protein